MPLSSVMSYPSGVGDGVGLGAGLGEPAGDAGGVGGGVGSGVGESAGVAFGDGVGESVAETVPCGVAEGMAAETAGVEPAGTRSHPAPKRNSAAKDADSMRLRQYFFNAAGSSFTFRGAVGGLYWRTACTTKRL